MTPRTHGTSDDRSRQRTDTATHAGAPATDLTRRLIENLHHQQAKVPAHATRNDWYMALAHTVRERVLDRYIATLDAIAGATVSPKVVAYLSAEFLIGPHLGNSLVNLGLREAAEQAVASVGQDLGTLLEQEEEPGLGNGGLGRLAACYMDSLATLNVPAIGYGIRYEFGIFDQAIRDGWQVERTDKWLRFGNPWEIVRSGGHATTCASADAPRRTTTHRATTASAGFPNGWSRAWPTTRRCPAMASPPPICCGCGRRKPPSRSISTPSTSATTTARSTRRSASETISKVLYPNDEPEIGKKLRLTQQYFFVSCSLQDMIRLHLMRGKRLDDFHQFWAAQLNDTHPSIAIAELMRLLVDEHTMDWDSAWAITQQTCGYTNHTLLSEALEKWPLPLFARCCRVTWKSSTRSTTASSTTLRRAQPGDDELLGRLSLIDETGSKYVRMAHLAVVGSHAINGVAALHSELLKQTVLRDFYTVMPDKFLNVTNGVTPRRWMVLSNPKLAALITRHIGDRWVSDLEHELARIEPLANDTGFQREWQAVKAENKVALAGLIKDRTDVSVDPQSLFDIQVKRLHEYKRQHLNVLYLITLYARLKHSRGDAITPRTVIFGGKAAPGYWMAKLIIKLINSVADVINRDREVSKSLRVVFLPDFNVKNSQRVYPAADLSEQISLAGKEASGTGNMKFSMNGALTIGTLDGANVEIREAVGHDNFFLFGLTAERRRHGCGRRATTRAASMKRIPSCAKRLT